MKLAEALILRSDRQKHIQQLQQRLIANARVQEGEAPHEDPQALLQELAEAITSLTALIQRINRTNAATRFDSGMTLTDALARRDTLGLHHRMLKSLVEAASVRFDRYSRSEVRYESTVDVAALQRQVDDLARRYRELDTRIQALNWQIDLMES